MQYALNQMLKVQNKIYETIIPGDEGSHSTFRPHNNYLQQKIMEMINSH